MRQNWRVVISMKDERQHMLDQTIEIPAPRILTEDALQGVYAYLDLVYDNIYYFSMDYAGAPVSTRGRVEVWVDDGQLESICYEDGYKHLCNHFDKAGIRNKVFNRYK